MRIVITGANGFVGKYLMRHLKNENCDVFGCDISPDIENNIFAVDLLRENEIAEFIRNVRPMQIYHLAGISNVKFAWQNINFTFDVNVKGTLNLLNAVKEHARNANVLLIGSSEEYGIIKTEDVPVNETIPAAPANPYAISKYAAERLGLMYHTAFRCSSAENFNGTQTKKMSVL